MKKTAKERYNSLETGKSVYLQRGREASRLTLPHILPQESSYSGASQQTLPTPFQSVGARGVNTLTSKLLLTMFPSGVPFFRYEIDQLELHKINEEIEQLSSDIAGLTQGNPQMAELQKTLLDRKTFIGDIKKTLSRYEKKVISVIEENNIKNSILDSLINLIITGNVCIYISKDFNTKVYDINNFSVDRDREGNLNEIVTREKVFVNSLPLNIQAKVLKNDNDLEREVEIFTCVKRMPDKWKVEEYIEDVLTSTAIFPLESLPFIVPQMNRMIGENYNYGFVTEMLGDLITLEGLRKAITQGSAAAAKILWMVRPNSLVKVRQLENTRNGGFVMGNPEDISALQLNKQADLAVASQEVQNITRQLSASFLMNVAVQRDGERVTATEINRLASDIDTALGGLYSRLAAEIQLPLVNIISYYLSKKGDIPKLPESIKPGVITGADAIRRNDDVNNLIQYVQTLGGIGMAEYINSEEIANRLAASLLIETDGLLKSESQVNAERAAQQQAQLQAEMAKSAAGPIANNATKNIGDEENGNS